MVSSRPSRASSVPRHPFPGRCRTVPPSALSKVPVKFCGRFPDFFVLRGRVSFNLISLFAVPASPSNINAAVALLGLAAFKYLCKLAVPSVWPRAVSTVLARLVPQPAVPLALPQPPRPRGRTGTQKKTLLFRFQISCACPAP